MLKKISLIVLLVACAFFVQTPAQTVADAEKQAAIKELLDIMESGFKASDMIKMIDAQTEETSRRVLNATIAENKDFTAEQKKEFEDLFFNARDSLYKRYQEKFLSKIDIDALINEMVNSVYDKNFSLAEIRDLIAFYKTPTGQKLVKTTPILMEETLRVMSEKLIPKIMEVGAEIEAEMKREVAQKIKEQALKKKKTRTE